MKDKHAQMMAPISFKLKFEENKAVKAATIALGCITGILLIYGIYVIFKKIFRWLGK